MSSPAAHADAHGHDPHAHSEGGHGSFKSYVTGFVLSVVLTAVPFWLVMGDVLDDPRVRSEEHTSESSHSGESRMPSSA